MQINDQIKQRMGRQEMERASESKQGSQEERNHVSRTGRLCQGPAELVLHS